MTWQGARKDSCPVTVGVDVTGIDVSITVTIYFLSARSTRTRLPVLLNANTAHLRIALYLEANVAIGSQLQVASCNDSETCDATTQPLPCRAFDGSVQKPLLDSSTLQSTRGPMKGRSLLARKLPVVVVTDINNSHVNCLIAVTCVVGQNAH